MVTLQVDLSSAGQAFFPPPPALSPPDLPPPDLSPRALSPRALPRRVLSPRVLPPPFLPPPVLSPALSSGFVDASSDFDSSGSLAGVCEPPQLTKNASATNVQMCLPMPATLL